MSTLSLFAIWFDPGRPRFLFDLDRVGASYLLLLTFAGLGLSAGVLFWLGVVGVVLRAVQVVIQSGVRAGFRLWARLLASASWPWFLALALALVMLGLVLRPVLPFMAVVCGTALLFLGVITCLAYVFLD